MYSSLFTAWFAVTIILPVFSSTAVALRFAARSRTIAGCGADDYIIFAALVGSPNSQQSIEGVAYDPRYFSMDSWLSCSSVLSRAV